MFSNHSPRFLCLLVLAGAFVLRAGAAVGLQAWLDRPPPRLCLIAGDAEGYWELGRKLADENEYSIYDPPRQVLRMPGFPLFLAGAMKLTGANHLAIRLLLAAVGTGACGLVYWLGRELFDHDIGLIAAAIVALSPTLIVFSVMFLSETLFAAALVACLIALAKLSASCLLLPQGEREQRQRNWIAIAAGVLAAVATLVRPTWLLIAPVFAVWHGLRNGRAGWMQSGLLLAGLVVTLSPWVTRNYLATGYPVVTTLWVGPSLYDGLRPGANGDSDMTFIERDGLYNQMSEYDADQHYRRAAREFVIANPSQAIQLAFAKLARFWSPVPNAAQFGNVWLRIGVLACFVPLVVLAVVGWWHTRRDVSRWLLPLAPIVYFSLVHAVFVGSLRYRLPAEYPLAVLAAVGGRWLMKTRGSF